MRMIERGFSWQMWRLDLESGAAKITYSLISDWPLIKGSMTGAILVDWQLWPPGRPHPQETFLPTKKLPNIFCWKILKTHFYQTTPILHSGPSAPLVVTWFSPCLFGSNFCFIRLIKFAHPIGWHFLSVAFFSGFSYRPVFRNFWQCRLEVGHPLLTPWAAHPGGRDPSVSGRIQLILCSAQPRIGLLVKL